jgi:hypothetical protein
LFLFFFSPDEFCSSRFAVVEKALRNAFPFAIRIYLGLQKRLKKNANITGELLFHFVFEPSVNHFPAKDQNGPALSDSADRGATCQKTP